MSKSSDKRAAALAKMTGFQESTDLEVTLPPGGKLEKDLGIALRAASAAGGRFVENMVKAGGILIELKETATHGEWLPLLERNGLKARTAQEMMRRALTNPKYADRRVFPATLGEYDAEIGMKTKGAGRQGGTVQGAREGILRSVRRYLQGLSPNKRESAFLELAQDINKIMEELK